MRNLTLFLVVLSVFTACKKDNDVAPVDLALAVAGTYAVTRMAVDNPGTADDLEQKYPQIVNGVTYALELIVTQTVNSTDRVGFTLNFKETGEDDVKSVLADDVEVRRNGSNYDLYIETTKIGTATSKNIMLDSTIQNERIIIEASR